VTRIASHNLVVESDTVAELGLKLSWCEHEDLAAYLIATCWEISRGFDPHAGGSFPRYARRILGLRTVDWIRQHRGRTRWQTSGGSYERPRTQLVSFDSLDPDADRMGTAVTGGGVDDSAHRMADELRLLDKRSRRPGRRDDWLGEETG
jgi:hypothetical protein